MRGMCGTRTLARPALSNSPYDTRASWPLAVLFTLQALYARGAFAAIAELVRGLGGGGSADKSARSSPLGRGGSSGAYGAV